MRNKNEIKINFIRHGKTELNEKHCYIGVTDIPLSENGRDEVMKNIREGIYKESKLVYVSPYLRCIETASLILPHAKQIQVEEFKEMDFGSFEGKCYEELKDNPFYRKWIDESRGVSKDEIEKIYGTLSIENSIVLPENKDDFTQRVNRGFKKLLLSSIGHERISLVVHGGTIMAILSKYVMDDYYRFMVPCAEGIETEVMFTEENGNIEISHFSIINRIHP